MSEERSIYTPVRGLTGSWIWSMWLTVTLMAGLTLLMVWVVGRTVWGAATLSYTLTENQVQIRYGYTLEQIDRAGITAARQLDPTRGRRVGGTGLRNLKEGWFTFAETGRVKLYASSTRPLTLIETGQGKWGISPAEPERFLNALRDGGTGNFEPVPGAFTLRNLGVLLILGGLVGIGVSGGTTILFIYLMQTPRAITYTLDREGVEIQLAWSRVRLGYSQIRGVEISAPGGTPWRTWGVSLPGLYWGRFSWRSAGPGVRLYATRCKPLVLIRTEQATFGLTPVDDERFVAELRARSGL